MAFSNKTIVVVLLHVFSGILCLQMEPQCMCSKFHYEEQMLEKMIRTELKFEDLRKSVEKSLQEWRNEQHNFSKTMEEKIKRYEDAYDRASNSTAETLINAQAEIDEKLQLATEKVESPEKLLFKFYTILGSSINNGQTVVFEKSMYNIGTGYNTATGVFKAPVNGIYMLNARLCVTKNYVAKFKLTVDGKSVDESASFTVNNNPYFHLNAVVDLNKGSNVSIQGDKYGSMKLCATTEPWTTFSGVLLR